MDKRIMPVFLNKLVKTSLVSLCLGLFLSVGFVEVDGIGYKEANAQSNTFTRQLLKRLDDMEKELSSLKRRMESGSVSVSPANETDSVSSGDRILLADMEVRIGTLDREIRSLRGDIERVLYNQKKLEEDITNFKEDTEFRFRELASGGFNSQPDLGNTSNRVAENPRNERPATTGGFVQTLTPDEAEKLLEEEERQRAAASDLNSEAPVTVGSVQSQSLDFEEEVEFTLSDGSPEEQYQEAFSYMQKGNFASAELAFKEFLKRFENDDLSGNAQYWLGESYYARKDFPSAAEAFLVGLQKYSESSKGPDSLLKLGMSLASMGQEQEACAAFGEIEARYQNLSRTLSRRLGREMERLGC